MEDYSFIDRMAFGWDKNINNKSAKQNWFFEDIDGDGVMNGIDCQPYNKKKQDGFPAIQPNSPFKLAIPSRDANFLKAPEPIRQSLQTISKLNQDQMVADVNQKNVVAQGAYNYCRDKNIAVSVSPTVTQDLNFGDKGVGGAIWSSSKNRIVIGPSWAKSKDMNLAMLHETSHAMDSYKAPDYNNTDKIAMDEYDNNRLGNTGITSKLYSDVKRENMPTEAKAYYVQGYYDGALPRNKIVDTFENNLGVRSKTISVDPKLSARDVVDIGNAYSRVTQYVIDNNYGPTFLKKRI
jgi:hypothetical protein